MIRFVTTNDGKFREVSELLASKGIEIGRLDASYPEVQADTLEEVVRYGMSQIPEGEGDIVVDDSGLFIDRLGGFPGVYSSYAFKTLGCQGILKLMLGWKGRDASFETCFGLRIGGELHVFKGKCVGVISEDMRGKGGFGFDPIFIPKGSRRTFAQMTVEEKNDLSHRGRAARSLARFLLKETDEE